jgi:hypothetical protein
MSIKDLPRMMDKIAVHRAVSGVLSISMSSPVFPFCASVRSFVACMYPYSVIVL